MHRLLLITLLVLAGCRGIRGPFDAVSPNRIDDPCLPIEEQQRLGRDRYALPDESYNIAPQSGAAPPGVPALR